MHLDETGRLVVANSIKASPTIVRLNFTVSNERAQFTVSAVYTSI